MSKKKEAKQKTKKAASGKSAEVKKSAPETKDPLLDADLKNAAGQVQEDLAPIREAANHAHTH